MKKTLGFAVIVAIALAAVSATALGATRSAGSRAAIAAGPSCTHPTIAVMGPITGPAASIGIDQIDWAKFYVEHWNKAHPTQKFKLLEGDTQLDAAKAAVVAQSFASNAAVLGIAGPAGSQEVIASSPILKRAHLAAISGSATRVSLTDGSLRGYFWRVVPNDGVQGPTVAGYLTKHLGVASGDSVMIVDDQEAYSTGLSDIIGQVLSGKGVKVDRESVNQSQTDFSSLVAKIGSSTKAVVLPWQIAPNAQLFAQQAKEQGKKAIIFGTDGTFDSQKFTSEGAYVSFFAPDVTTIAIDNALVANYKSEFGGDPGPFGAPTWVATQVVVQAVVNACKAGNGKVTRDAVRAQVQNLKLKNTILGIPVSFSTNGDVVGAGFFVFKITGGKYHTQPA